MIPAIVPGDVTLPEFAIALITVFEGSKLVSYQDSGGIWTVGLGHTHGVTAGMTITKEQEAQFFQEDAAPLFLAVRNRPLLEAAALVSFGYNCGLGKLQAVLAGHDLISNPKHTEDAHGVVRAGLVARRTLEELMCLVSQQFAKVTA